MTPFDPYLYIRGSVGIPALLTLVLQSCVTLSATGCAQNTESPVAQPINQPVRARTDQAAQGAYNNITVNLGNGAPGGGTIRDLRGSASQPATANSLSADPNAVGGSYASAGQIINSHLIITTGGSSGAQSASGGASGNQQATPTTTVEQHPEMKPEVSVAIPVTVALPGGAASGTAAAAGRGSTINLTAEQQADLRTAFLKAAQGDTAAMNVVSQLLGIPAQTLFPKPAMTPVSP